MFVTALVLSATLATLPPKQCTFHGPFGDLNQDRRIDAVDLAMIASVAAGRLHHGDAPFTAPAVFADLNLDYVIDDRDVALLSEFLAGEIDMLPVVEDHTSETEGR